MDSLANYGSDDEYEENTNEKLGTSVHGGNRSQNSEVDANYDEVQMDLSEESNNNNSVEDDERADRRRHRSRSREDGRSTTRTTDSRSDTSKSSSRYRREKSEDRDRDRSSKKYDFRSNYKSSRESSRDDRKRSRRSGSRERRRSGSKERRRSGSKERRRSGSKDRRRSGSKERRRSRSPRREHRRRSRSNSKERGNSSRYGKRFDRTSNKIAQLEKLGIEIKTPDAEFVTPQMLLQRSMDEQVQKVKNSTGIELPKYYNPAAMNPARYADQIQKRRLLWQKKDTPTAEQSTKPLGKVWEQTTFAQDSDGKVASKFKRLMGIKDNAPSTPSGGKDILKKQEEMFTSMEQQYEVARTATHTMRGVGLGFGTYNSSFPR